MSNRNQVVVVTGASAGIGAALALALGRRGDRVVLVARRADELADVARQAGPTAVTIPADMTRRDEVERVVAESLKRHAGIDVWVNNVGRGITRPPSALTDDDIDAMVLANVKSALYGMQSVLPHFQERGRGHIINISSMLGRIPFATYRSAYCGAKHFLNALTATFRAEVQQTHPDIQISLVSPGVVRTEFGINAVHGGPDSRQIPESQSADEVASVIVATIDSRAPDVYSRKGARDRVLQYFSSVGSDPL
jgi:short-subunit dehydrogenase